MKSKYKHPKLGFRNASVNEQISTAQGLANGAQNLPESIRDKVFLAELKAVVAEALAARSELAELRTMAAAALTKQKNVMERLRMHATACAGSISAHVHGDETELRGAGLDIEKSKRVRTGPPGVPTELRVRELDGAVTLIWRNPMRRSFFSLQCAEGSPDEGNWKSNSEWVSGKGRFTFRGLKPNVLYWFRVKAHNPNGESPWSDFVSARPL